MGDSSRVHVVVDKRLGMKGLTGTGDKMENITVIECGCQDGSILSPFIIFQGMNLQSTWYYEGVPNDWIAAVSNKGWTTDILGIAWL